MEGRLPHVFSTEMKKYQGLASNRIGRVFNDQVFRLLKSTERFKVKSQVVRLNGKKISRNNGEELGDIDVLAVDEIYKKIFPIETKSFSTAKTASEISNERNELFGDGNKKKGKIAVHLERVEWLERHIADLIHDFELDPKANWDIQPICVLDMDLLSAYLVDPGLRVVVADDLLDTLTPEI